MSYYVGQRITIYCLGCGEKLRTVISSPSGTPKTRFHIKCLQEANA